MYIKTLEGNILYVLNELFIFKNTSSPAFKVSQPSATTLSSALCVDKGIVAQWEEAI